LRLRFAEIVSQIIASECHRRAQSLKTDTFFGYLKIGAQLDAQCCFGRIEQLDARCCLAQ
jgi:hypothetical protein